MKTRPVIIAVLALALVALLAVGAIPSAWGGPAAQGDDPTAQQLTIDAVVQQRFAETATAQAQIMQTQTALAPTVSGPTLTAAFNATVDAAFNQALTATADAVMVQAAAARGLSVLTVDNATRAEQIGDLDHGAQNITALAFGPGGGPLVTGGADGTLRLWDVATGVEIRRFTGHTGAITALAISRDGARLVSASEDGTLRVWDLINGVQAGQLTGVDGAITTLAFGADGALVSGGDTGLLLWDAASGDIVRRFEDQPGAVTSIAVSPDGAWIVSGSDDGTVRLWDITGTLAGRALADPGSAVTSVAFSPDGMQVAVGTDAEIGVVDVSRAALVWTQPTGPGSAVAYSPSGRLIASASQDTPVTLWDAASGAHLVQLGDAGAAQHVAFDPAGAVLASAGDAVRLWGVRAPTIAQAATATPTPQPPVTVAAQPSATPRPELFPTNVIADVQIAEQLFEHGRMFWLRHTRQIWVMVDDPDPNFPGGDWYCFNDTFQEGEMETDPSLVPPSDDLSQPRRGFGKVWREHSEIGDNIGWAITPEFELTSPYTYIAGGYVDGGQYFPGPGEHRLMTLYGESMSFYEQDIRGDCLGGTWRQTP